MHLQQPQSGSSRHTSQGLSATRIGGYDALPILPRGVLHRTAVLPLVWGARAVGTVERRDHRDSSA